MKMLAIIIQNHKMNMYYFQNWNPINNFIHSQSNFLNELLNYLILLCHYLIFYHPFILNLIFFNKII